jgi:hypothetical protein
MADPDPFRRPVRPMNVPLIDLPPSLRLVLLFSFLVVASGLSGCTTTDSAEDTTVYPTPAERNQEMQERMGDTSRSLM